MSKRRTSTTLWLAGLAGLLLAVGCVSKSGSVAPTTSPTASSQHADPSAPGTPGLTLSQGTGTHTVSAPPQRAHTKEAPQRAKAILAEIQRRQGEPPPGYVGGRIFQNRERRLPPGVYREYDVNPKVPGRERGPERIVLEVRTGKAYYTDDHYRAFVPLN